MNVKLGEKVENVILVVLVMVLIYVLACVLMGPVPIYD